MLVKQQKMVRPYGPTCHPTTPSSLYVASAEGHSGWRGGARAAISSLVSPDSLPPTASARWTAGERSGVRRRGRRGAAVGHGWSRGAEWRWAASGVGRADEKDVAAVVRLAGVGEEMRAAADERGAVRGLRLARGEEPRATEDTRAAIGGRGVASSGWSSARVRSHVGGPSGVGRLPAGGEDPLRPVAAPHVALHHLVGLIPPSSQRSPLTRVTPPRSAST
jgi:hypothetical protein